MIRIEGSKAATGPPVIAEGVYISTAPAEADSVRIQQREVVTRLLTRLPAMWQEPGFFMRTPA